MKVSTIKKNLQQLLSELDKMDDSQDILLTSHFCGFDDVVGNGEVFLDEEVKIATYGWIPLIHKRNPTVI